MQYSEIDLDKHLKKDHSASPLTEYLKEIVYGGNDGIVTTFAVVAGFTGASQNESILSAGYLTIMLFGLANLFADGTSMGLGNFLSLRSQKDQYEKNKKIEEAHIKNDPLKEKEQSVFLLEREGFNRQQALNLAEVYSTNPNYWAEFMMKYELRMDKPQENPYLSGIATLISFIFFGSIPLLPFVFLREGENVIFYAVVATFSALGLLGIIRWQITKLSFLRSVGEIILVGGLSAGIAFMVGTFFKF
jgi:VIT1/CCC1 family predicted Fe2+/Mn2+ transporter